MTASKFAVALLIVGIASPASAQTVPEDVRCMLLSNIFAKGAADEKVRNRAAQNLAFFMGRLDDRSDPQGIVSAIRIQASSIDAKTAGPAMEACASRMARAAQSMQALGNRAAPHK